MKTCSTIYKVPNKRNSDTQYGNEKKANYGSSPGKGTTC